MTTERNFELREAYSPQKNKSTFFILPLLGYPSYWYYGLINSYLGDEINKPELTLDKIFIQVRSYDNKLAGIPYFNQFYRLEDDSYMYVYDIPSKFEDDYMRFVKGKYSEISEEAKQLICRLSGIKPVMESIVYKVLYKTKDQRVKVEELIGQQLPDNAELYSIPNLDEEIYQEYRMKNSIAKKTERESTGEGKVLQST